MAGCLLCKEESECGITMLTADDKFGLAEVKDVCELVAEQGVIDVCGHVGRAGERRRVKREAQEVDPCGDGGEHDEVHGRRPHREAFLLPNKTAWVKTKTSCNNASRTSRRCGNAGR